MGDVANGQSQAKGAEFISTEYPRIQRLVSHVAWRHRLRPDEAADLKSAVHLKLVEDDYAVLRRFEGRSAWSTYLQTVITRVFLDERIATWGKWRPSVKARRQGATAIRLERLIHRDGMSFDEACSTLRGDSRVTDTRASLEQMRNTFPHRCRPKIHGQDVLESLPLSAPALNTCADRDAEIARLRLRRDLAHALVFLSNSDRRMLGLRYCHGWTIARVAQELRMNPKRAYRDFDRIHRMLRERLAGAAATWKEARRLL